MSNKREFYVKNLGFFICYFSSNWNLQEYLFKEGYCKATAIRCTGNVTLPQLQLLSSTSLCGWEAIFVTYKILADFFSLSHNFSF